ncbi:MAG TPA: hypothetical protein VFV77_07955 [Gammaproteobacteria bacterium]|nr:hypothetical protein [Gammaproteobacteria bacterium]
MAVTPTSEGAGRSIGEVLGAGWKLFLAGLPSVFPWILVAELLQTLPLARSPGSLLDTDLSAFMQPSYLWRTLLVGTCQAFLYSVAVLRMAELAGMPASGRRLWPALRAMPSVLIGYLIYELVVIFGLGMTLVVFLMAFMIAGLMPAWVLSIVPLAPTAAASTALALFIYPAVLERRGPLESLSESSRLARTAWARVSLVITVPALALLAVWFVDNGPHLIETLQYVRGVLQKAEEEGSPDALQAISAMRGKPVLGQNGIAFQIVGAILGGIAWWYTLAVCFAQYRDLKTASLEAPKKRAH